MIPVFSFAKQDKEGKISGFYYIDFHLLLLKFIEPNHFFLQRESYPPIKTLSILYFLKNHKIVSHFGQTIRIEST